MTNWLKTLLVVYVSPTEAKLLAERFREIGLWLRVAASSILGQDKDDVIVLLTPYTAVSGNAQTLIHVFTEQYTYRTGALLENDLPKTWEQRVRNLPSINPDAIVMVSGQLFNPFKLP